MIYRNGTLDDAPAMARIFNHYVATSPVIFSCARLSDDDMHAKLQRLEAGTTYPFFVAQNPDGSLAGYAYAHLWQPDPVYDTSWEVTIYLHHAACGRGIGGTLLRMLVDECRLRGAHTLVSFITDGNEPCIRMHLSAGFERVGCIPQTGLKFGRYYDDAIYWRTLSDDDEDTAKR